MKYIFHTDLEHVTTAVRAILRHKESDSEAKLAATEFTFIDGSVEVYHTKKNKDSYTVWGPTK